MLADRRLFREGVNVASVVLQHPPIRGTLDYSFISFKNGNEVEVGHCGFNTLPDSFLPKSRFADAAVTGRIVGVGVGIFIIIFLWTFLDRV